MIVGKLKPMYQIDKEIYFEIYQYMVNEIIGAGGECGIILDEGIYVSIFRRSDGDIEVSMYSDEDHENDIDGGGVIDMSDEIINDYDSFIEEIDIVSMQKYIKDKTDFAYSLVFTG